MPRFNWFRSLPSAELEPAHSATQTSTMKRSTTTSQRSLRSRSLGSGMSHDVKADDELECTRCKTRRRFTVEGVSYRHKDGGNGWSCSGVVPTPPSVASSIASASLTQSGRFVLDSGRTLPMTTSLPPNAHPSIIFIDCPP